MNLVLFTVAKENSENVRLKATARAGVIMGQSTLVCTITPWGGPKKPGTFPPRTQKERNRRVFPILGLLGLGFFFRGPSGPERFSTCSRQVSDGPQKTRHVIYMHFVCNYISDAYRPICNLYVIAYKLHINYISPGTFPTGR